MYMMENYSAIVTQIRVNRYKFYVNIWLPEKRKQALCPKGIASMLFIRGHSQNSDILGVLMGATPI
jgi:hypothetical protein